MNHYDGEIVEVKNYVEGAHFYEKYSTDMNSPAHICYKADALTAELEDGTTVKVHYTQNEDDNKLIAVAVLAGE